MALSNKQKSYIRKHYKSKDASKIAKELKIESSLVTKYIDSLHSTTEPAPNRKKLFFGVMLSIPILFFVLLEIGLRIADYRGNLDLFIYPEALNGEYAIPNPEFAARYFFNVRTVPSMPRDAFLAEKPENGYRIFVMGGSTANGYPYGNNVTFSRLLQDMIRDIAPDRHVEVINVATSAINTYALYDQVSEILTMDPDAIMIYSGHNEYYGALGVGSSETFGAFPGFIRTYLSLQRYKTFLLLRDSIVKTSGWFAGVVGSFQAPEQGTLMMRMVREQSIPLDSELYEMGKRQFESNLNAIVKKFERRNVPVFIGSLASNLKDQWPFVSVEFEDHPEAQVVYDRAQELYRAGDYSNALSHFLYAKDLDALRFRAPISFNEIIRDLADSYNHVYYATIEETLLSYSENGVIGFDLMLEHLHPNYHGYALMGKGFFEAFKDAGFPGLNADVSRLKDFEEYTIGMQLTDLDILIGNHRIRLLTNSWPFVEVPNPAGYPRDFKSESKADSLAFEVVNNSMRWDMAKVELAEYHEQKREYTQAFRHYYGLIRDQHYNDSPYIFAARLHMHLNQFNAARPLFERALELDETNAFVNRMMGAVEVDAGNIDRGIVLLERSRAIDPDNVQTLFNLSGAYGLKNDFQKADEILRRAEQINPQFPGLRQWRAQLNQHLNRN